MSRLRLFLLPALTLATALVPASAVADPPEREHFRDIGTFVDPDFCGTGQAVEVSFNVLVNLWISPEGPEELVRSTVSGENVFTNPTTNQSVVLSFAGTATDRVIEGMEGGIHTVELSVAGLAEKIQIAGGPVLLRDAGLAVIHITVDENDEVIAFETVVTKGPHPDLESEFELFCEVMTEALGIV